MGLSMHNSLIFTNSKGALFGFISGVGMCLFITVSAMVYPKPKGFQLPVSVDGCSSETSIQVSGDVWMAANNQNYTMDYRPEY